VNEEAIARAGLQSQNDDDDDNEDEDNNNNNNNSKLCIYNKIKI
jgi:hypothetical protein